MGLSVKEWLTIDKDAAREKIIGIAVAVLAKLGVVGARELGLAIQEYLGERLTPDGWTREERGHYLVGRLVAIRKDTFGPPWIDRLIDEYVIDWLVDEARKSVAEDGTHPAPGEGPAAAPEEDPYYQVLSHERFERLASALDPGDEVFRRDTEGAFVYEWYCEKQGLGFVPVPPGFVLAYTVK
jgi:hypothetical protein